MNANGLPLRIVLLICLFVLCTSPVLSNDASVVPVADTILAAGDDELLGDGELLDDETLDDQELIGDDTGLEKTDQVPGDADDDLLGGDDKLLDDEASEDEDFIGEETADDGDDLLDDGDEQLGGDDDLLDDDGLGDEDFIGEESETEKEDDVAESADADEAHAQLFAESRYPSASTCRTCHERQYQQWSVSQHAYAQLSPVFHSMHATILKLTNGTNGDFCIRCHTPIGMNIGEGLFMNNMDRHPTSREGITCVACHRSSKPFGKISGRLALEEGPLTDAVYGPSGNSNLKAALNDPNVRVTADPGGRGRKIHGEVEKFSFMQESGFCGSCHDVTLVNGFRLEEAFSEYKMSPAAKRGESCQDCHMGNIPGVASGYDVGPAAIVGGVPTNERKLTDHRFVGPDHSVIHPALFPVNSNAAAMASMREWLKFDYKAGWGTDDFEDSVTDDGAFPERWSSADDRYDAREIIDEQLKRLGDMTQARKQLLKRGYVLDDVKIVKANENGLVFKVKVRSGTDGHNVPTGFTAERLVFLQVVVTDREGQVVFKSGDLDPNGDVRDLHSLYVHNGELPLDSQLFSLQSKFITRNIRGGEREQVLAVNYSPDPLPFLRADINPTILTGRTLGARIHKQGIEPNGQRWAKYKVDGDQLTGRPPYQANVKLIAGMIPVNLVNEIKEVGFDYNMSAREIADAVVAGHQVLWERTVTLGGDNVAQQQDNSKKLGWFSSLWGD